MEGMRDAWTDARLDDLVRHMDKNFDRIDARFEQVDTRFERMEARFDSMQRMTLATYITAILGLIATQL
jgi:hypothetical protein